VTETCRPDQAHLITNVETALAVAADADQTAAINVYRISDWVGGAPRAGA
jgi:hypothetical protein